MEAVDDITGRISNVIKRSYSEISNGYTFFEGNTGQQRVPKHFLEDSLIRLPSPSTIGSGLPANWNAR